MQYNGLSWNKEQQSKELIKAKSLASVLKSDLRDAKLIQLKKKSEHTSEVKSL